MKASEFIKELQSCIDYYGDLEVVYRSNYIQDKAAIGITNRQNVFIIIPDCYFFNN